MVLRGKVSLGNPGRKAHFHMVNLIPHVLTVSVAHGHMYSSWIIMVKLWLPTRGLSIRKL